MAVFSKLFGDANRKHLSTLAQRVAIINAKEKEHESLTDSQLRAKTEEFKTNLVSAYKKINPQTDALMNQISETADENARGILKTQLKDLKNAPLDEILPEAFSVVREAAKRTMNQRHYNVQLMGGIVLHEGQVAEMKTGEGKTLTSTLNIYLNAVSGNGVHVVTVNDYLARRDAVWMGQIFDFLGLSIGIIIHDAAYLYDSTAATDEDDETRDEGISIEENFLRDCTRHEAYMADITYGTNNEFGFDYLRDNMVRSADQKVQRRLNYAIVDEVDSILIDEARTPLIISAPDTRPTDRYYKFTQIVNSLSKDTDYSVDEKVKAATLTEDGVRKVEKALGVDNLYVEEGIQTVHHIEQALKAQTLFTKEKDYTVKDGQVVIVDEFTGRLLEGRRYSEGLHQAIEAKENLTIQQESKTMATITFQNYFRLYEKLAGMTGTAETEAEELAKIYNVDVTTIPTNKPMIRDDRGDQIFKTEKSKFKAVVAEVKERNKKGQPVLVGTISIEKNEELAHMLEDEGLKFSILNAKQHEREAETIAGAGERGAITIATNMAGRGVDIKLGGQPIEETKYNQIKGLGGLHVIGTERHESRRIDNQLRGRSGRQGDSGSSQFYVSLEDDLMRVFGGDRARGLMRAWPDDMPIENKIISKSIESAQKKVEGHNFDIRKHLVEYDDVANKQRMHIYAKRDRMLKSYADFDEELIRMAREDIQNEIVDIIEGHTLGATLKEWKTDKIIDAFKKLLQIDSNEIENFESVLGNKKSLDTLREGIKKWALELGDKKFDELTVKFTASLANEVRPHPVHDIIKELYLRSIDLLWVEHLETIQYLRTGIGLRGYGQRDPVVEYKKESKGLFNRLLADIQRQFAYSFMNVGLKKPDSLSRSQNSTNLHEQKTNLSAFGAKNDSDDKKQKVVSKPRDDDGAKIGRNDPCHCGSGKKFKKCHGA